MMTISLLEISSLESIDFNNSFQLAKQCSILLTGNEDENIAARKIAITILDNWNKLNEDSKNIWIDIIEAIGFYPYLEKLELKLDSTKALVRKGFYKSNTLPKIYFHEEQRILSEFIYNTKNNLVISAPTSFGKSLLIEDIVSSKQYKNIVIIQPTLALLDETRKKLLKYSSNYQIIIRTSQIASQQKGNIYLFTAERVMEYPDFPKIDFFIIDEFYKISIKRDDERADTLNNAFYLLSNKMNARFMFLGPNIDSLSEGFTDQYNAIFYKTNYSLVENETIDKFSNEHGPAGAQKFKKESDLFDLLYELKNEQTLIYCSSPNRVRSLSKDFCKYLLNKEATYLDWNYPVIEWIEKNVDKNWFLIECLKREIGIHDGALQKHLTSTVIDYFNTNKIKYLFCTSTIIEGVNTSAKNVVYFDPTKGLRNPIDFFDYSNIKGRAGRMMVHFIGKIYTFNKIPDKQLVAVDIPVFEQTEFMPPEILIHLDEKDVTNKKGINYSIVNALPQDVKLLFAKNGLSISGQINILKYFSSLSNTELIDKFCWSGYPRYKLLGLVIHLGWSNFLKPTETTRPMTANKLVKNTFDYGYNKSINSLIASNIKYFKTLGKYKNTSDDDILDDAIREAFQILKHWLQYKVPKWLLVIHSILKHECINRNINHGDYTHYASLLENDFIDSSLSILLEYGVPKSAILKLEKVITVKNISENQVLDYLRQNKTYERASLIEYEKQKIMENL